MLLRSARAKTLASVRLLSSAAAEVVDRGGEKLVKARGKGGSSGGVKERNGGKDADGVKARGGRRETVGRTLLNLVCAKRSAVAAIQKWKEEGRTVRKYELNRIVKELRKIKRYKLALEICEWMAAQEDIDLQPGDYAVHLDLVAKFRGLKSAEKFFEDIPDSMKDHAVYTSLLHTYVQSKLSDKAESLFEKMSESGLLNSPMPYNHMLSMYVSKGQLEKVLVLIQELKKNSKPDIVSYNLMLTAFASKNDVQAAEKIYLKLKQADLNPDWVTYSVLTNLYIKSDHLEKAKLALKEMEKLVTKSNRVAYASLVSLHGNVGDKDSVNRIWKRMRSCFKKMNDAEYLSMIWSLVKLDQFAEAKDLYDEWEKLSGTGDARIPTVILAEYMNRGEMHLGEQFYERMVKKGITPSYSTWEILTQAYLKQNNIDKALDCFKNAVGSVKQWAPNEELVGRLCKELEDEGNVEGAEQLITVVRKAGYINTQLYNSLLRTYVKAGKKTLVVEEDMARDEVELDEETQELISKIKQQDLCE